MHLVYDGGLNTNRAYLGTDTRSQCLFIGCALAVGLVLLAQRSHEQGRLAKGELWRPTGQVGQALCGVAGIVGAAAAVTIWVLTTTLSSFPYSGGFFLIGLSVGAVILAAVAAPRSIVPRVLSLSPIRYVGRISYGLYIWHWPIFLWLDHERTGLEGYELFAVRVLVTFGVSVASFHLVERPIRMGTFVSQWRAWLVVPAGVGAVLVAVFAATTGLPAGAGTAAPPPPPTTGTTGVTTPTSIPSASGPPVRVLLVGDSIAETLGEGLGLDSVETKYDYTLYDRAILGCGVADGTQVIDRGQAETIVPACGGPPSPGDPPNEVTPWPTQWSNEIAQLHPNVVVEGAGRWEVVDRLYQGKWENILQPQFAGYIKSQLEKAAGIANAAGVPMVFLTAPCTDEGEQPDGAPWPEDNSARRKAYNKLLEEVAAEHPQTVSVADLDKAACPRGVFAATIDGIPVRTSDGVHFTWQGGQFVASSIMPPIVAAGRAQMAGQDAAALPRG